MDNRAGLTTRRSATYGHSADLKRTLMTDVTPTPPPPPITPGTHTIAGIIALVLPVLILLVPGIAPIIQEAGGVDAVVTATATLSALVSGIVYAVRHRQP